MESQDCGWKMFGTAGIFRQPTIIVTKKQGLLIKKGHLYKLTLPSTNLSNTFLPLRSFQKSSCGIDQSYRRQVIYRPIRSQINFLKESQISVVLLCNKEFKDG